MSKNNLSSNCLADCCHTGSNTKSAAVVHIQSALHDADLHTDSIDAPKDKMYFSAETRSHLVSLQIDEMNANPM